jgi:uncharacterized damage-inducible protein DinB
VTAREQDDAVRAMLIAHLQAQRDHVLGALVGLSDDDLRRPVLPSGWSCLGLVQHLALDVERFWFRSVVGGEEVELPDGDEGWTVGTDVAASEVLDLYRDETARADAVIAATPLDADPAWWPDFFGDLPPRSMMRTVMHVVTETATHAGHLDAVRELLDGRTWLVLTD